MWPTEDPVKSQSTITITLPNILQYIVFDIALHEIKTCLFLSVVSCGLRVCVVFHLTNATFVFRTHNHVGWVQVMFELS